MSPRRVRLAVLAAFVLLSMSLAPTATAAFRIRGTGGPSDFYWSPKVAKVAKGAVVKWIGVQGFHNVTSYGKNWSFSKELPVGTTVKRTFRKVGTFRFYCTPHAKLSGGRCTGMCGKVVVK